MMAREKMAGLYRSGQELPPTYENGRFSPQVIVESTILPDNEIFFRTHTGREYTYSLTDVPRYPVRPDRSVMNWMARGVDPRLPEVAVGDILGPPDHEEFLDDLDTPADRWAMSYAYDAYQTVTGISPSRRPGVLILRTMYHYENKEIRHQFPDRPDTVITFPSPDLRPSQMIVPDDDLEPVEYENADTGKRVLFLHHQYGAGRWPGWVPPYDPNGSGQMRPPQRSNFPSAKSYQLEWMRWIPASGKMHRNDPRRSERTPDWAMKRK